MAKRRVIYSIIILIVVALIIIAMHILSGFPTQIDNSIEQYQKALQAMSDHSYLVAEELVTIRIEEATYTEKSYTTIHTKDRQMQIDKAFTSGSYSAQIQEIYTDRMLYACINRQSISCPAQKESSCNGYIPAAMFDCQLYKNITGTQKGGVITINFASPSAPEAWAAPSNIALISALGTVTIHQGDRLVESSYEISYLFKGITFHKRYMITYQEPPTKKIVVPSNLADFKPVESIDGLILLERLCGILTQIDGVTATIQEDLFCGAFGDQRTTVYELTKHSGHTQIKTSINLSNTSQSGNAIQSDAESNPNDERFYALLLSGIPAPTYTKEISIASDSETIQLTCVLADGYAQHLTEYICSNLYGTPDILLSRATTSSAGLLSCKILLDPSTYLPKEIHTEFQSVYTIDGVNYPVEYSLHQIFRIKKQEQGSCFLLFCC